MDIKIKTNLTQEIICTLDAVKLKIGRDQHNKFLETLKKSDFLIRITKKTGLRWVEPLIKIKYSKEADFESPDTILIDYNRGSRAVSSAIHEAFHLMLRQVEWTENDVVKRIVLKYPELENSPYGIAYKMEQMFAYLLQNEIYQEIAKDLNFDASKDYWDMNYIVQSVIPYEFESPFLKKLVLAIIKVWNGPTRSRNIFKLIEEVDKELTE